jgi:RNA polymerase sigma-70 factor (ECF subfamily)
MELDDARANHRFATSVRDYGGALATLASRLCSDPADAEDLVQDTYERALRAWERLPADANVRAWLVTILLRLFIDRQRRAKRNVTFAIDRDHPSPEPPPPPRWASVTSEQLAAAIAQLGDDFRRVFEMHASGRKSYQEIADELAISTTTVRTRLFRARRRLLQLLAEQTDVDAAKPCYPRA